MVRSPAYGCRQSPGPRLRVACSPAVARAAASRSHARKADPILPAPANCASPRWQAAEVSRKMW
jgi:hypothetical protein